MFYSDNDSVGTGQAWRPQWILTYSTTNVSYISMHARYTEFIHCMQSRRDGIIITTSPAAGVLSSDCLRYGVLVQEELCTQRPCCQEHTGGK